MTLTKEKKKSGRKAKTTDVLVAWCIDRSGSMQGHRKDTVDGFNAFLKEQKEQEGGQCLLSLVLFDDKFAAPIVATDVKEVLPLTPETYWFGGGGMTALYDAVGVTINGVEAWLENNPSFKGKVVVEIWTDGGENQSTRWSRYGNGLQMMLDKISEKQAEGWTFAFLGAGGSAWLEGQAFQATVGAVNTTQVTPTSSGMRTSYAMASASVTNTRAGGQYLGNNAIDTIAQDSAKLAAFGIEDVEEALAGTSNSTDPS